MEIGINTGIEWDTTTDIDTGELLLVIDTGDFMYYLTKKDVLEMLESFDYE